MQLLDIPLDQIELPDYLLRKIDTNSLAFQQMKDDIELNGLLQPINVVPIDSQTTDPYKPITDNVIPNQLSKWQIKDGCHRYICAQKLGWSSIPSIFVASPQTTSNTLASISANLHRKEMTLSEYRAAIRYVIKEHPEYTTADIARKLSKGTDWVSKIMGIQNVGPEVNALISEGRLTLDKAFALSKFNNNLEQQRNYAFQVLSMNNSEAVEFLTHEHQLLTQSKRENQQKVPNEITLSDKPINRKWSEIERLLLDPTRLGQTLLKHNITDPSVIKAAQWALKYAFSLDPETIAIRRAEHEKRLNINKEKLKDGSYDPTKDAV